MLSDLEVLVFQALGRGMLPFFWTLEFEAVEKGEMLPVFQILSFEAVERGKHCPSFKIYSWEGFQVQLLSFFHSKVLALRGLKGFFREHKRLFGGLSMALERV